MSRDSGDWRTDEADPIVQLLRLLDERAKSGDPKKEKDAREIRERMRATATEALERMQAAWDARRPREDDATE